MPPPIFPTMAASAAFYAVFSVFVVAFVVLTVITLSWAVRRDRAGRQAWVQRRRAQSEAPEGGRAQAPEGEGEAGAGDDGVGGDGRRRPPSTRRMGRR
jgi:hypothetical protein